MRAYKWVLPEDRKVVLDEYVKSLVVASRGRSRVTEGWKPFEVSAV